MAERNKYHSSETCAKNVILQEFTVRAICPSEEPPGRERRGRPASSGPHQANRENETAASDPED